MEGYCILAFSLSICKILATLLSRNALDAKPPECLQKVQEFLFHFPRGVLLWNSLAYEAGHPWNSQGQHTAWQESPYSVSHLKSPGQPLQNSNRTQATTRENEALCEEEELESDSDDKVECDLSKMEITEELLQYFAQPESHREEQW